MKKSLFATFIVVACLFLSLSVIALTPAKAEVNITLNTFTMEEGAAVRLSSLQNENGETTESNGLRFSAEISVEEFSALQAVGARFGVIISAQDLLKTTEIDAETVFGQNPAFYFTNEGAVDKTKIAALHVSGAACQNVDEDENIEICGSIVNIKVSNFTRSFVGRVYIAIPTYDEQTGQTTYEYHFAPYYNGSVSNNTRSIFYVSQRAIESNQPYASTLQSKYINPFKETSRYTDYSYLYYVEHHYIVHDENGNHSTAHVERMPHYATLDTQVTASPIEKPDDEPSIENLHFIYDIDASVKTQSGLVYAGGMLTLKLYYETAGTIDESHKDHTLEALVADFLDVNKASENFGLHINGNSEDWVAHEVYDPKYPDTQIGISLSTDQPSDNRYLLLSDHFFDQLRAFGVESITFNFHTGENSNKKIAYCVFQEEDMNLELPVYDETGTVLLADDGDEIKAECITIYIADVTPNGGVLIRLANSSANNKGDYHFGSIKFKFFTTNTDN